MLFMMKDELDRKLKKLVAIYRENLKDYILDLYNDQKYEDLRSEIEFYKSISDKNEMKLKEIKYENRRLSSRLEKEVEDRDLRDIARELEDIVQSRRDMEGFEYLLRKHYVKSNMTQTQMANRANVEYTTLNKILNNRRDVDNISKDYIVKLCIGLKLNLSESQELLMTAGYVLLGISERELFIRAAIQEGLSVTDANLVLDMNGMKLL